MKNYGGGRFKGGLSDFTEEWASSINFDMNLYKEDIALSIAHSKMLSEVKIITKEEAKKIRQGLLSIQKDIEDGKLKFTYKTEDIHMSIENELIKRIGEAGRKLHTARSRNDQIATDLRMHIKIKIDEIIFLLENFNKTLTALAKKYRTVLLPGFTHLQHAQAITLSKYFLAYKEMFLRDKGRLSDCRKRADVMPLGSGALNGVNYKIDRNITRGELGFSKITRSELDAVSDRDFIIEYVSALSIVMMHLSRLSEEYILYSSSEFSFFEPSDAYSTGSSIMPQKKNPDMAELLRGKTGRVYGALMNILTIMKGLPLSYNKDFQEGGLVILDSENTVISSLTIAEDMLKTTTFNVERMREAVSIGFMNATAAADYLVKKGESFRNAHKIIGEIVYYAEKNGIAIEDIKLDKLKTFSELFERDIYRELEYK